jgi:phosphoenolpyruvate synthase/pyruvate phosphate dikinase
MTGTWTEKIMNILHFLDPEDAALPDPDRIGQQGLELSRVANAGLQILPTLIIGVRAFRAYQVTSQLDDGVIVKILEFASQAGATELTIRPTSAAELIGLPSPETTALDRNHIRYLVERIYRSWKNPRTRAYRESQRIPEDQTYLSVIIQAPRQSDILSLSTRNPRTGEATTAAEFRYNVNNRIVEFRSDYNILMRKVEEIRKRPSQIDFQSDDGKLYVVGLGAQVMSDLAILRFVSDQYSSGLLKDTDVLSIVRPRMLGGVWRESYAAASPNSQIFQGIAASPGVAAGQIVWPGSRPESAASKRSILVVRELSPDDVPLLIHCVAAFSTRGGKTSHLGVTSRGLGLPAVTGLEQLDLDIWNREIRLAGERLAANVAAVDGISGFVCLADGPRLPRLRLVQEFRASFPISVIDWIDDMAQSVFDRGDFAALPMPLQTNIAALRQMVAKIRAGHD